MTHTREYAGAHSRTTVYPLTQQDRNCNKVVVLIFLRIPSRTREGAFREVCSDCWPARRGKENVSALYLYGDWSQHVRLDRGQHRRQISGEGWAPDDDAYGI